MMADYLLDTNYLIYAFDETTDTKKRIAVLKDFAERLDNDDDLFITPLIRYEVLRGVEWHDTEKLNKLDNALTAHCKTLDVSNKVADLARDLYRLDRLENKNNPEKNLDKRKFDMFHYATAKVNDIELLSEDTKDMPKIDALYQRLQDPKQ